MSGVGVRLCVLELRALNLMVTFRGSQQILLEGPEGPGSCGADAWTYLQIQELRIDDPTRDGRTSTMVRGQQRGLTLHALLLWMYVLHICRFSSVILDVRLGLAMPRVDVDTLASDSSAVLCERSWRTCVCAVVCLEMLA